MGSKRRMGNQGGLQVHSGAGAAEGRIMRQRIEKICPTCCCCGIETRTISHPMANVYGWTLIDCESDIYTRRCVRCNGTGFIPIAKSVPSIPGPNKEREGS
jgi:hypothetical protein